MEKLVNSSDLRSGAVRLVGSIPTSFTTIITGCSSVGRMLVLGTSGHRFESYYPDETYVSVMFKHIIIRASLLEIIEEPKRKFFETIYEIIRHESPYENLPNSVKSFC